MYTTTSVTHAEVKEAALNNDHMFFLNIIAHYLGAPFEGDWPVCQTRYDETYSTDENIVTRAIVHAGTTHVSLYDGTITKSSDTRKNDTWEVPIPDLIKSLLDQIELFGQDRQVCYAEIEPVWQNWLAYHQIEIDPHVYEFL
jgi:hypothetical protein